MALGPLILDGIRYRTARGGVSEQTGVDIRFNQPRSWTLPIILEDDSQGQHITGLFAGYPVPMVLPSGTAIPLVTISPSDMPGVVHDVLSITVTATEMIT